VHEIFFSGNIRGEAGKTVGSTAEALKYSGFMLLDINLFPQIYFYIYGRIITNFNGSQSRCRTVQRTFAFVCRLSRLKLHWLSHRKNYHAAWCQVRGKSAQKKWQQRSNHQPATSTHIQRNSTCSCGVVNGRKDAKNFNRLLSSQTARYKHDRTQGLPLTTCFSREQNEFVSVANKGSLDTEAHLETTKHTNYIWADSS
jgi:hypothetical protein